MPSINIAQHLRPDSPQRPSGQTRPLQRDDRNEHLHHDPHPRPLALCNRQCPLNPLRRLLRHRIRRRYRPDAGPLRTDLAYQGYWRSDWDYIRNSVTCGPNWLAYFRSNNRGQPGLVPKYYRLRRCELRCWVCAVYHDEDHDWWCEDGEGLKGPEMASIERRNMIKKERV